MTDRPYRISVVCTGNICRSPMGEYLLRAAIDDAGLTDRVQVESAGVSAEEQGNPIDRRAAAALRRGGTPDLGWSAHRARRFEPASFDGLDLVLAADSGHLRRLRALARTEADRAKVVLLRSFDPVSAASGDLDMADPWYYDDAAFDTTFAQVRAALPGVVEHVRGALAD